MLARLRRRALLVLAASLLAAVGLCTGVGSGVGPGIGSPETASAATTFTFDLYRPGVFTTQATWWYCTAASVQIMRNIDRAERDHSTSSQRRYFDYMYARNWHRHPATSGVDPPGFLAGLRAFVDPRYRLVASTTFDNAIRSAVSRLRATRLPVALIVDHGRHAWVLTGFTSSADPARTLGFGVSSVRIVGPLYGRQSRGGYDSPPDTRLSVTALRRYFNGYDFRYGPSPWDDRFVTLQP